MPSDFLDKFLDWLEGAFNFSSNGGKESSTPISTEPITHPTSSSLPQDGSQRIFRPWRLTRYYVSDEKSHPGERTVPMVDSHGIRITNVSPSFFSSAALEGTALTDDGKLVNVGPWVKVSSFSYAPVWEYHKKHLSKRPPGYSGLVVKDDKVVEALSFSLVSKEMRGEHGFGRCHGMDYVPWKTVAADIGTSKRADPRYKGKGGLLPIGTRIFIKEFVGLSLPDGSTHDGYLTVNDSGGGIFGAHCDIFCGGESDAQRVKFPEVCHVSFDGISERIPEDYVYGLKDA